MSPCHRCYYEAVPGLQLLHCLSFPETVQGGLSVFWDGLAVAEELQRQAPQHFLTLSTSQVCYYKEDAANLQRYRRPIIVTEEPVFSLADVPSARVLAMHYAPPWELPQELPQEQVRPYYEARHALAALFSETRWRHSLRLREGDLIAFNNRQVLHGRGAFVDPPGGGRRHLQGAYVDTDAFSNTWRCLARQHGYPDVLPPLGNHSH